MTIKNETLISMIKALGEDVVAAKLSSKIQHDVKQKQYHSSYNKTRNLLAKNMKQLAAAAGMSVEAYLEKLDLENAA